MLSKPSLSEVRKELQEWRESKNRGKWVPAEIKQKAVELLSEHKVSQVITALNLSSGTFRSWRNQYSFVSEHYQQEPVFVTLPNEETNSDKYKVKNLLLKITRQVETNSWTLEGNLTTKEWKTAINLLENIK